MLDLELRRFEASPLPGVVGDSGRLPAEARRKAVALVETGARLATRRSGGRAVPDGDEGATRPTSSSASWRFWLRARYLESETFAAARRSWKTWVGHGGFDVTSTCEFRRSLLSETAFTVRDLEER